MQAAFAFTVIATVWKLLLLVIIHVTREREGLGPYHHTLLIGGTQWMANRTMPSYDAPQGPVPSMKPWGR